MADSRRDTNSSFTSLSCLDSSSTHLFRRVSRSADSETSAANVFRISTTDNSMPDNDAISLSSSSVTQGSRASVCSRGGPRHGGGHQFLRALLEKLTATLRKLPPVRPDAGWALPRKISGSFKKCNLPLLNWQSRVRRVVLGYCVRMEPFSRGERENYREGLFYTGGRGQRWCGEL